MKGDTKWKGIVGHGKCGLGEFQALTAQSSLPAREEQGQAVDRCLTLHGIGLLRGQCQDLLVAAVDNFLVDLQGHLQGQAQRLVEEVELLREGIHPEAIHQMCQLKQASRSQQQVPKDDVQPAGIKPAPQHTAQVAWAQDAEKIEAAVHPTACHETHEQEAAGKVVDGTFHILLPTTAHWPPPEELTQRAAVGTHLWYSQRLSRPLHKGKWKKKNQAICTPRWLLTTNSTFAGRNVSGGSEKECQNIVRFMED